MSNKKREDTHIVEQSYILTMDVVVEKKFPSENLVPKNETGVSNFLKKYPTYNGEGITIAIFDSGVDPKSAGLQVDD